MKKYVKPEVKKNNILESICAKSGCPLENGKHPTYGLCKGSCPNLAYPSMQTCPKEKSSNAF